MKSILEYRKNKMNYLNRYIIFGILYLITDLIGGSYKTGTLGLPIGGFFMAPLMFIASYFFAAIIGFWFHLSYLSNFGFKTWIKEWHNYSLNLSLWFYDFSLIYLFYTIFTGGLKPL